MDEMIGYDNGFSVTRALLTAGLILRQYRFVFLKNHLEERIFYFYFVFQSTFIWIANSRAWPIFRI